MTLHNYVIHEIEKKQGGNVKFNPSKKLPVVCELANDLVERLLERYQQERTYGVFEEDGIGSFKKPFDGYCAGCRDGAAFLGFSTTVSQSLAVALQGINQAVGGYLLYTDYERQGERYLSVYLIRNVDGFQFSEADERYNIGTIPHLGIDKLAMACRINTHTYAKGGAGEKNYLSFLKGRAGTDAAYFYKWIEAKELQQSAVYTKRLIDIFKAIPLPAKMGDIDKPDRDQVRAAVGVYVQSLPSRQLNLGELSRHVFGEEAESRIADFAQEKGIQMAAAFTPSKAGMRGMAKVSVEADEISLRFPVSALSDERVKVQNGKVIITSQNLAAQVSAEIQSPPEDDGAA